MSNGDCVFLALSGLLVKNTNKGENGFTLLRVWGMEHCGLMAHGHLLDCVTVILPKLQFYHCGVRSQIVESPRVICQKYKGHL